MEKNSKKVINAWCSYDIANSAYMLSISTVLYPMYYDQVTQKAFGSDMVNFLGLTIKNTVIYEYAIALAYLVIIFLTLAMSGMADLGGLRKRFMQVYTFLGGAACIGLYGFTGDNIALGLVLPFIAVLGFAGSLVYYNSFLPVIATPDLHDKISARGFSFGYAGSMLLLLFNLYSVFNYEALGFSNELEAIRFSFIEVGVWWILIAQIAFFFLKEKRQKISIDRSIVYKGFQEIAMVFKYIKQHKAMYRFLIAFFFFSMGVQTIIIVASLFGKAELKISDVNLIISILLIQVVAIGGASVFGVVSSRYGNKLSLIVMLAIWIGVCFLAYFIENEVQFYVLATLVGLVLGGIQSQSRSTWSKLIPENSNDTASYFSFYDSTEKFAITIGMLSFGVIEHVTGSMRNSTLLLSLFFVVSIVIISLTNFKTIEDK